MVSDRGLGLTAALPEGKFATAIQQYCQWHVAENLKKRINDGYNRAAAALTRDANAATEAAELALESLQETALA